MKFISFIRISLDDVISEESEYDITGNCGRFTVLHKHNRLTSSPCVSMLTQTHHVNAKTFKNYIKYWQDFRKSTA